MAGVSVMTDFLNRTEIESRLARVLSKDLHGELSHLLDMLGDPPDLSKVPAEYWNNGWRGIQKDVEPILLDVFMTQAQAQMNTIGVGVDWALVKRTRSIGRVITARLYCGNCLTGLTKGLAP